MPIILWINKCGFIERNTCVKLYRSQDNDPTTRSLFFKSVTFSPARRRSHEALSEGEIESVKVITTSASWLSLTFGIMIYLTLISTIFPYQCINSHHFFLFINIYELSFLYQSHDTKYKCEFPKMFKWKLWYFWELCKWAFAYLFFNAKKLN